MKTVAYCAHSFRKSVQKAAKVKPATSPPLTAETFNPKKLEGYHFVYFKLHGLANQPYWYGDNWITALTAEQLGAIDLSDSTVFVANCYLLDSPMFAALQAAGAKYIIGGHGLNYAKSAEIEGADYLGATIRRYMATMGFPGGFAFRMAKQRLKLRYQSKAIADAMAFQLYEPESGKWWV